MRRTSLCILLLLFVCLSGSMSLACSNDSSPSADPSLSAGTGQTTTAGSVTVTRTSVPKPGGLPDVADPKSLSSYRQTIVNKQAEGEGAGSSVIKYEWVRDQKAEHLKMEDGNGKVTMEMITIGDKSWIWMGMVGWVEQPLSTTQPPSTMPSDLAGQLEQALQDVENSKARFVKKGTETANSVRCIRYEFQYDLTTEMPDLATGGTRKAVMHSSGEIWIADQSGIPAVLIKSKSKGEIALGGKNIVIDTQQDLTDIGADITIKPPEGAMQPPTGIPGFPTGFPTLPPNGDPTNPTKTPNVPTAATTPATTGTALFNDDFQRAWNSKWVWTDPNDDANYSLSARPGFLRLTVPDENDLAGASNYDAPRLLVEQKGNFALETLAEFDPQEGYQGAGLLVWQDEDNFLRLEFGFGGMGGDAKNIAFVKQEEGGLDLVKGVDLPDATKRVELRLQRVGDRFTASWRQANGTWQQIGTHTQSLAATVEVGITQIAQYGPSEISADFDYFKLFAQ